MIYSLNGIIVNKDIDFVVIECSGVGYGCRTTTSTLSKIGKIGENVKLLTYLHVREDVVEIFGFYDSQELNCFKMLISVSGVGPKAALAILSDISAEKFALIVASEDSKEFTKIKGIGIKIAQRIVLELKDKIKKENIKFVESNKDIINIDKNENLNEAFSALLVLGYTNSEVTTVLKKVDTSLPSAEIIKQSLKLIGFK